MGKKMREGKKKQKNISGAEFTSESGIAKEGYPLKKQLVITCLCLHLWTGFSISVCNMKIDMVTDQQAKKV